MLKVHNNQFMKLKILLALCFIICLTHQIYVTTPEFLSQKPYDILVQSQIRYSKISWMYKLRSQMTQDIVGFLIMPGKEPQPIKKKIEIQPWAFQITKSIPLSYYNGGGGRQYSSDIVTFDCSIHYNQNHQKLFGQIRVSSTPPAQKNYLLFGNDGRVVTDYNSFDNMHETAKDKIRLSSSGCWIDESSIFDVEDSLRGDEGENDWNTNRRFDQLVNRYNCQSPEGAFYQMFQSRPTLQCITEEDIKNGGYVQAQAAGEELPFAPQQDSVKQSSDLQLSLDGGK